MYITSDHFVSKDGNNPDENWAAQERINVNSALFPSWSDQKAHPGWIFYNEYKDHVQEFNEWTHKNFEWVWNND